MSPLLELRVKLPPMGKEPPCWLKVGALIAG